MNLNLYLDSKMERLRSHWQTTREELAGRLTQMGTETPVFGAIGHLLRNLAGIIERKGSAEQAVDAALKPIVQSLRTLQAENQLSATDMVFLLFLLRDSLRELSGEAASEGGDSSETGTVEKLEQVTMLLNRLGLVFFDGAMRQDGKEEGLGQDVLAIEYALLYERTRQMAITDRLTGLYNFGYFLERLKEEKIRAERYHRLLSLVILDLDHFKIFNDANGHPAGNEVLKKVARILKEEAREVDVVARYGGEELVLILPETSRKRASELARRILRRVEETTFDHMESQPLGKVTLSAGVATFPVDASNEESLIKAADESLYEAKSKGRNRVESYLPPQTVTLSYRPYREVSHVSLVGDFNNWDKDVDPMARREDGTFQFIIALNPGIYHYKFVLEDVEWIPDPNCLERVHDGQGGDNSILRVSAAPLA
jgi:diguanylate cyclase (GGDEF)-like protein